MVQSEAESVVPKSVGAPVAESEAKAAVHVNAAYDAMPNEIEDAGAVFKMAFLDAEKRRLEIQQQLMKQEGEVNIANMKLFYQNKLNELALQIRGTSEKLKEHKDYIEKKYNIALRAYNYDDETGVLRKQIQTEQDAGDKEEVPHGN